MSDFDDGLAGVPAEAAQAAAALEGLRGPAEAAAQAISAAFERAGASLTRSLARASSDGKITLDELAAAALAVVNTLARNGGGTRGGDLGGALSQALSGAFAGARADGGPVIGGGSYLVGERGPEVFRPASAGEVAPASYGMTINVSVERGAEDGLVRSEAQIAQMLARAVSLGARRA